MYPAPFEYFRPATIDEAIALLQTHGEDAKILAGGHSLIPAMKLRLAQPRYIVDIGRIRGMNHIRETAGRIVVGAMATHDSIERSALLREKCPLLPETAGHIGDVQVRNKGTIGGSLAHADPGADLPAVMLALDAQIVATSAKGSREIAAAGFFKDVFTTALEPDEVLTEIRVPVLGPATGSAYLKFPNPASRYAIAGVAAVLQVQGGSVASVGVALTGASGTVTRLTGVEQELHGRGFDAGGLAKAAARAAEGWEPQQDLHASADYRRHLARVMTRRALDAAVARAQG